VCSQPSFRRCSEVSKIVPVETESIFWKGNQFVEHESIDTTDMYD
jgi:maltoporin